MRYRCSISITNRTDKLSTLHLEPWGEQISLSPNISFQIVAEAEEPGEMEIEYGEKNIVVWAWAGSTLKVLTNGEEIGERSGRARPIVPPVPKGMNVSSVLRSIERKEEE